MTTRDLQRIRQRAARQDFDRSDRPARGDGLLDEMRVVITTTKDAPGARERVVEALARLLAARAGE